jgi:hypothetical protein
MNSVSFLPKNDTIQATLIKHSYFFLFFFVVYVYLFIFIFY